MPVIHIQFFPSNFDLHMLQRAPPDLHLLHRREPVSVYHHSVQSSQEEPASDNVVGFNFKNGEGLIDYTLGNNDIIQWNVKEIIKNYVIEQSIFRVDQRMNGQ